MKKTLTILALGLMGAVAYAGDLETKVELGTDAWTTTSSLSSIELTSPIDISKEWQLSVAITTNAANGFNKWGTAILATGTNATAGTYPGGFQLYLKVGGNLNIKAGSSGPIASDNDHLLISDGSMLAADTYTITLAHNEGTLTATVVNSAGTQLANQSWTGVQWAEGTQITQLCNVVTTDMAENKGWVLPTVKVEVEKQSSGVVPEPATAALSLLALAGLAARRRRK